jgi:ADP-heptose:LPS heptosyltransferase
MNARQRYRALVSKAKRLIEFCTYWLFDNTVLVGASKQPESNAHLVAVVFTKLMGDYFIWLPYGLALTKHLRGQGLHVVFVCNSQWRELAQHHYPDVTFVQIDRKRFTKALAYRARTLHELRALPVHQVLNPCYPRDCLFEDAIVRALGSTATGFDAVFQDRPWPDRVVSRRLYGHLLPPLPDVHQAVRHTAFLAAVSVIGSVVAPMPRTARPVIDEPSRNYFVISPGASHVMKTWPVERFVEIASKVLQARPGWRCLLIGAPAEQTWIDRMQEALGSRACSVAGRLTLLQLVEWIHSAQLVIGNDSAAAHIAAACGVPSLVVCHGAEFGRCQPYDPAHNAVAAIPVTVVHPMGCFGCNWNCRYHVPHGKPAPCVDRITTESVWTQLSAMLPP